MLEKKLADYFGYKTFRPGQKEVIEAVLQGKDVLALLPTGSGKSLCYQLPTYLLGGSTLIISPLLSLMEDQVEQLKRFGEKKVVAINSFLTGKNRDAVYSQLASYRFIFVSPEMLGNSYFQKVLNTVQLSLIAVDEAHCISQWGFDFRPEYLKIGEIFKNSNRPPILALTATATSRVLNDIEHYLLMHEPVKWLASVDRPNIAYQVVTINNYKEKINWLENQIKKTTGPGIVYTQSRKKTEAYAMSLQQSGIRVAAYHAGMEREDRQLIQHQFLNGELDWIIATNAFGMGVHKANIRQIIHDHLPSTIGSYIQEVGRAGRDGNQSFATMLYSPDDEQLTKSVAVMDYPNQLQMEQYLYFLSAGQLPSKMLDELMITETSFRILDYWMKKLPPDEVLQQMLTLSQDKMKEVDRLVMILLGTQCIREQISAYFEQPLLEKPAICCSVCGEINDYIEPKKQLIHEQQREMSWKERLNDIFMR